MKLAIKTYPLWLPANENTAANAGCPTAYSKVSTKLTISTSVRSTFTFFQLLSSPAYKHNQKHNHKSGLVVGEGSSSCAGLLQTAKAYC
eukprot:909094-Pelagomonas_calceolata.AAC.5